MAPKKGNGLHKRGNSLPAFESGRVTVSYEQAISAALQKEFGNARYAAKTLMRWTGASPRTAKHWLAGSAGPSGGHLIALIKNSDAIFGAVLHLASRENCAVPNSLIGVRERRIELRALLNAAIEMLSNDETV
jgi:hypothetical protein